MADDLQVAVTQGPGGVVASFSGTAGLDQIDEFERQLRLLAMMPAGVLVLDFEKLTWISSMGLGALIRLQNELAGKSVIRLAALAPAVAGTFKNARLDGVLEIHASVDAALKGN